MASHNNISQDVLQMKVLGLGYRCLYLTVTVCNKKNQPAVMSSSGELKRGSPNWEMESKDFKNTCENQTWQLKENHRCV